MAQYLNKLTGTRISMMLPRLGIIRRRICDKNGCVIGSFYRGRIYDLNGVLWGYVDVQDNPGYVRKKSGCSPVMDRYGMLIGQLDSELNILSVRGKYLGSVKNISAFPAVVSFGLIASAAACIGIVIGFLI
ncbi:hypothetical protein SDC9_100433 [bioreactor metagenome]|uniref:Uncharacterized protein n=1 Tax=bioreactor metagenome TaxID=1076179 RepID=A0A645AVU7_9ZZZZ|nr:hypothetical protein [Oscillospiraceae bacterium]